MIQDSDFEVFEKVSDVCKFSGERIVKFTSNIFACEFDNEDDTKEILNVATAYVIDNDNKRAYHVNVVFEPSDIVSYNGTAYVSNYMLPVAYDKYGKKTNHGRHIKGFWFKLFSSMTINNRHRYFNAKTGDFIITNSYRIYSNAKSLIKIDDIDENKYRFILTDTYKETTKHIEHESTNFSGGYRIKFTSNLYINSNISSNSSLLSPLLANAMINGVKVQVSMEGQDIKTIPASRWQPFTVYRPFIVNGRGNKQSTTIKDHLFDVVVERTIVNKRYTWNEELQEATSQLYYVLVLQNNSIKKAK